MAIHHRGGPGISGVSMIWFIIFDGSAIWPRMNGGDMEIQRSGENVMWDLMGNLPSR